MRLKEMSEEDSAERRAKRQTGKEASKVRKN